MIDRLSRAMEIVWGAPDALLAPPLRWGIACFPEDGIDASSLLSGAARRLSAAPDLPARDARRFGDDRTHRREGRLRGAPFPNSIRFTARRLSIPFPS